VKRVGQEGYNLNGAEDEAGKGMLKETYRNERMRVDMNIPLGGTLQTGKRGKAEDRADE
jgi:hypothetical protein